MNLELHIASPSVPPAVLDKNRKDVSGSGSEFSGLSLLARIWMWLSQIWGREAFTQSAESVFCLGPNDTLHGHRFQGLVCADHLNRYRRRMLARYTRLGLSLSQIKAWVKARRKSRRFQTPLAAYLSLTFFLRAARHLSRLWRHDLGMGEICKAPLTPD